MQDFIFGNKTKIYFGKDQLGQSPERRFPDLAKKSAAGIWRRFHQEDRPL